MLAAYERMFSQSAISYLSSLMFQPDAERRGCFLPLGSIYWADEIPDFGPLFLELTEDDRNALFHLFSIRMKIWDGKDLDDKDRRFWDAARELIPAYPLFRRLELSADDQKHADAVLQETVEGLEHWFSTADKLEIRESDRGIDFSVTFDLAKEQNSQKRTWWRRLFGGGANGS